MAIQNVWVLIINDHACDTHVEVFPNRESASHSLYDYCCEGWEDDWGDLEPMYPSDVIEYYSDVRDMKYEIVESKFYS